MRDCFHLTEYDTTVGREVVAGVTTFMSMAYILIVAPSILAQSGMEWGAVFLASIVASIVGTLVMSFYANVPFALAPGLGMASFFVVTVCGQMGFTWQQGLSMVFICGLVNILITVTRARRLILASIPKALQVAIAGGIGVFIAYVGVLDVGFVTFTGGTPTLAPFSEPDILLFILGVFLSLVLYIHRTPGAILISIIVITLLGVPLGITNMADTVTLTEALSQIPSTFGAIFSQEGLPSLLTYPNHVQVVAAIASFVLVDTFDTIGTFVGTGRNSGTFTEEELSSVSDHGDSRLGRALFSDSCATSVGALLGTSNTTTVIESTTGIVAGGRTGLTGLVVAGCMLVAMFFAGPLSIIPPSAYSAVLVLVGILMLSSFREIDWDDITEAAPAFFAGVFMALCYNITYGIAMAFIVYCLIKLFTHRGREVSKTLWFVTLLFVSMFVLQVV